MRTAQTKCPRTSRLFRKRSRTAFGLLPPLPLFALHCACALLGTSMMVASAAKGDAVAITAISVDLNQPGKPISPDLFGIFFEDINYSADGGLYAELVQNRSFEYEATEQSTWGPLTGWEFVQRGGGAGDLWVDSSRPIHPNNPRCALIRIKTE